MPAKDYREKQDVGKIIFKNDSSLKTVVPKNLQNQSSRTVLSAQYHLYC